MKRLIAVFLLIVSFVGCKPDENSSENDSSFTSSELSEELKYGQELFEQYCTTCHANNLKEDATGPALGNVHLHRSKDWFRRFTRNSQMMIAQGDSIALCLWQQWKPTVMNSFPKGNDVLEALGLTSLSDNDIDFIYDYIANANGEVPIDSTFSIEGCVIEKRPSSNTTAYSHWNIYYDIIYEGNRPYVNILDYQFEPKSNAKEIIVEVDSVARMMKVRLFFPKARAYLELFKKSQSTYSLSSDLYKKKYAFPKGEPAIIIVTGFEFEGNKLWFGYKKIEFGVRKIEKMKIERSTKKAIEKKIKKIL
ncbi:MAG: cytochrome c [Bacteroidota bacterium]